MLSLNVGSSDTRSNLPKNPLIVLNAGSRTLFSGSAVNGQSAGKIRFATSLSKKYLDRELWNDLIKKVFCNYNELTVESQPKLKCQQHLKGIF